MSPAERVLKLASDHPDREQLIILAALSVLWLEPQNPEARLLLVRYRDRQFAMDALRETALQLFLIAGFQASLEAAFQIKDVFGVGLPSLEAELQEFDAKLWWERGLDLQAQVYQQNVDRLRANLEAVSTELATWPVLVGYGLVMSRPGLPPHWRELFEVVVLAVQGFPRQLHSHLRGAIFTGASREEVELILDIATILGPEAKTQSAWHMWRRIREIVCQNGR